MEIQDTEKKFCSILFDVMCAKGVEDVVCSPGSRNAPLLIAAAARNELRKHIATDERTAAFMALGMAMVSRSPVALICTSGTALLNYAPAVAEAFYQGVPLIVISADRPMQWIDQDDSQTLRQFEALSNFVKKSYELPSWGEGDDELLWYANRVSNDAMIEAMTGRKGPVHINVRLGEPLGRKTPLQANRQRIIEMISSDGIVNKEIIRNLAEKLAFRKVLFVSGFMTPDMKLHRAVERFCALPNVAAMTETLSNLHLGNNSCSIDSVLTAYTDDELDLMAPDVVISTGGALVSRKLKEYLRRNRGKCEHWSVGWSHTTVDCFMSLTKRISADPAKFLSQLGAFVSGIQRKSRGGEVPSYSKEWTALRIKALEVKDKFVAASPWSELKAISMIMDMLPKEANLSLSNGTPVRYAQILSGRLPHASYCNRGVSGIDGSTSTAVGQAMAYRNMTVLLSGDLSMAYDAGALALREAPDRMKIIVMDNQGGGIFRFIPTTSGLEEREEYFCVPPLLPLRELASGYGWEYFEAHDEEELRTGLKDLLESGRKAILRVVCDGEPSAEVLKNYMKVKINKLTE